MPNAYGMSQEPTAMEWNGRVIVVPHHHQLLWQLCKNFTALQWRDIKALPAHSGEFGSTFEPRLGDMGEEVYRLMQRLCGLLTGQPTARRSTLAIPHSKLAVGNVFIDFTVKLLTIPRGHDSVLIVVNPLIQLVHFPPNRKAISLLKLPSISMTTYFDTMASRRRLCRTVTTILYATAGGLFLRHVGLNCALLRPPIHQMMASMSVFTGRWR